MLFWVIFFGVDGAAWAPEFDCPLHKRDAKNRSDGDGVRRGDGFEPRMMNQIHEWFGLWQP